MIKAFLQYQPQIAKTAFIADSADVIGRVTLLEDSSVWYGCVLRGDGNDITVGKGTNIQDLSVVHIDSDCPTDIGDHVTIGHRAIIHGCTIENNVLIGMGAIILSGAHIEENTIIGAGALVASGKRIPKNSLALGMPAKVVRQLTDEEIESIRASAEHYKQMSQQHRLGEETHEKE